MFLKFKIFVLLFAFSGSLASASPLESSQHVKESLSTTDFLGSSGFLGPMELSIGISSFAYAIHLRAAHPVLSGHLATLSLAIIFAGATTSGEYYFMPAKYEEWCKPSFAQRYKEHSISGREAEAYELNEGYLQSYCKMTEEEKRDELSKFPIMSVSAVLILLTIMGELIYGNLPLPQPQA